MLLRRETKDLLLYVSVGFMAVVAIFGVAIYVPERYVPSKPLGTFIWFTFFLFLFLIKAYWKLRRSSKFWLFLIGVMVVHVIAYLPLLTYIQPAALYLLLMPLEVMLIVLIGKLVFDFMPNMKGLF